MKRPSPAHLRSAIAAAACGLAAAWIWAAAARPDPTPPADGPAPALASAPVIASGSAGLSSFDGVVEAVRQTALAAQVSGAVVSLEVKVGDTVREGQVLARLDARAAQQAADAGDAQARSARATLDAAQRDFARQQQLFEKKYISQAALDRAEAQFKAAQAEAAAQLSSAGAAHTQSGFYVIRAPYAGIVSAVPVVQGDMAMPGRTLITVYDPASLRVTAAIPQTVAARFAPGSPVTAEIPGAANAEGGGRFEPVRVQLLPAVDAATHTRELRIDLPASAKGLAPGMFARAWLPVADGSAGRLFVPASAVVRRAELSAVYVIGPDGKPLLRQVRTGRQEGDSVEVLSGVSAGERVALQPQVAAAVR